MSDTDEVPAGLGHNQPPAPTPLERAGALVANANRWVEERKEISDSEQAGLAQGFITQLRDMRDDLDKAAKVERKPHDDAIIEIRRRYLDPVELVGIALGKMLGLSSTWLDKEKTRIARETAERQRAAEESRKRAEDAKREAASATSNTIEAELAAIRAEKEATAAAKLARKAPERATIKGDYSAKAMGLRTYWSAEVIDEAKALKSYARNPEVRAVCLAKALQLATQLAKETKREDAAPPGFRFVKSERAT